jgi:hypothetical protein
MITALSMTTFSIMTFSITIKNSTLSQRTECCYAKCRYAKCHGATMNTTARCKLREHTQQSSNRTCLRLRRREIASEN